MKTNHWFAQCTAAAFLYFATQSCDVQAESIDDLASLDIEQLGLIKVTTRRREENLMNVPVAVSVVSAATIENAGLKTLTDLAAFTPGLFVESQGIGSVSDRSRPRLVFRGLATSLGTVFIDGAPYAGTGTPDFTDLQRVEVMTGPQSVYFGRSTFAGAINYITKTPGNDFRSQAIVDLSSDDGQDYSGSVEGPIVRDRLTARVSAHRYSFGGQYKSGVNGQSLGKETTTFVSVALAATPTDTLKFSTYYSYTRDEDGAPALAAIGNVATGPTFNCNLGGTGGGYWCGALPRLSGLNPAYIGDHVYMDTLTRNELVNNARGYPVPFNLTWLDHFGLKRVVNHVLIKGEFTPDSGWLLASQVSYNNTKTEQFRALLGRDLSNVPNPMYLSDPAARAAACAAPSTSAANAACFRPPTLQLAASAASIVNDFSGEVRVSSPQDRRLRATLGASYYRVWGPPTAGFGIQNSGRLANASGGGIKTTISTPAVFAGVYFDVTDRLTLNAEARYQWDGIARQQTFPTLTNRLHDVFESFSPRVTADFKVAPDSLLYATFSQGYQPGGFNAALVGLPQSVLDQLASTNINIPFQQEKLTNFEIGHKGTWFDSRLRTRIAAYSMNWSNGQVSNTAFYVNPNGANGSTTVVKNTGKVALRGVELTSEFSATEKLTISSTFNYVHNKISAYVYSPNGLLIRNNTDVIGNELDHTPHLTFSLSTTYRHELSDHWSGVVGLDYEYRSKFFIDPTNIAWIGGRSLVNAHFSVLNDRNLEVSFYVKNLFNDDHLIEAARTGDGAYAASGACPPCFTAAAPPIVSPGVSTLNVLFLGLPDKRTFGARMGYRF
ncbi:TonB-dependent receptor [Caulobacter sp. AP07]|uniref:TonB-dependent receptor n=1 Tax=Caulobacter sp. AP07 TaxID=1144304 RepID=UPI0012F7BCFA|nr:TonB-dependent receptor [Caulobacter sp. AP07]